MQVKCGATHYVILFLYICFNLFTVSFDLNYFPQRQEMFKHVVFWQTPVIGNCLPGFPGLWWDRIFMLSMCSKSASKSQWDGTYLVCFSPARFGKSVWSLFWSHQITATGMAIEYYRVLSNVVRTFLPVPALWTMAVKRESRSVTG